MTKKKAVLLAAALLVLVLALAVVYFLTLESGTGGNKTIEVQISYDDVSKTVAIETKEEFLRGAMEQENLISGTESQYGLYVTEVDGRVADESKQEWWQITENGEMTSTGVDQVAISDGGHYEFTLETGW